MSGTAFLGIYSMDRERNNLGCDNKELRDRMKPETADNLKRLRDEYQAKFQKIDKELRAVADNNRIKNKIVDFKRVAERAKCYFNFRSLDFYMYRIGYTPVCSDMYRVGIEYQMHELMTETQSLLMTLGEYHGFNAIHWLDGNGYNCWVEDGEPDFPDKEKYIREDLGILYY